MQKGLFVLLSVTIQELRVCKSKRHTSYWKAKTNCVYSLLQTMWRRVLVLQTETVSRYEY